MAARKLWELVNGEEVVVVPCCHDAFSARVIAANGFKAAFVSGFAVAAAHGMPDTGLMSFGEVLQAARFIREAVPKGFPLICDADTGFGNAMNVKRTVQRLAEAGFAALMLEDQVFPKQCGHTEGKQVIHREEAVLKIRAARDAREELGLDILILARTDARGPLGLEEAINRCNAFLAEGADMTFLEAPLSEEEMAEYCRRVKGPKMANMLARGKTPSLSPAQLKSLGYSFVAFPLDLLAVMVSAFSDRLQELKDIHRTPSELPSNVMEKVWELSGFTQYQQEQAKYGCFDAKRTSAATSDANKKAKLEDETAGSNEKNI